MQRNTNTITSLHVFQLTVHLTASRETGLYSGSGYTKDFENVAVSSQDTRHMREVRRVK